MSNFSMSNRKSYNNVTMTNLQQLEDMLSNLHPEYDIQNPS